MVDVVVVVVLVVVVNTVVLLVVVVLEVDPTAGNIVCIVCILTCC